MLHGYKVVLQKYIQVGVKHAIKCDKNIQNTNIFGVYDVGWMLNRALGNYTG